VLHRDLRPANVLVSEGGMVKVADFGTSRFLEVAGHGTTVIGSPPYMAPEQFHGKAVFASDIYSLGVTMYEMLTGGVPYETPSPADLEKLMRGELVAPPRARNSRIPKELSDIVMRTMAPAVGERYQRAGELLDDLLAARSKWVGARNTHSGVGPTAARRRSPAATEELQDIQGRLRARETPASRFCWHCRKPLHSRTDRCPFCGEGQ
jgi:eukaryotic-like serine/threonine-protein kinase